MKPATDPNGLSHVVIALMRGVIWREDQEALWQQLLNLQARVRDHVGVMGLTLEIDEAEGYAILRQAPDTEERGLPRLVARRPLSFPVSLLLVLLRKTLVEVDGAGGDRRVVLTRSEMVEMMRHFLPATTNEARQDDRIGKAIKRVEELGFLRPLKGMEGEFEVVRLIKTFVDGQMLESLLATYRDHAAAREMEEEP